jgi:hypothetical protein
LELDRIAEENACCLRISVAGYKTGEVNLRKAAASKNRARSLTLIAVIQDDNSAAGEILGGHLGAAPSKRAVIIDDEDIVLDGIMPKQRIDLCVRISRGHY